MRHGVTLLKAKSKLAAGTHLGGAPRIYYGWMKPGSFTRRRFEKMRNPFVDLGTGTSLYYRDTKDPPEAALAEADARGLKGMDNNTDLYNEYRIVPDLYPEGFQWKHKLDSEYNQWRSNTWWTPDLIPQEHRGRLLCNFQMNVVGISLRNARFTVGDSRQWVFCSLYVGTGKGLAGLGRAIAPSMQEAKQEAVRNAFENLQGVDLEHEGIMHPIRTNVENVKVLLYPSNRIVANSVLADVLLAFGFTKAGIRIGRKCTNRDTKAVYAVFQTMKEYKSINEIAMARGKVPYSLMSHAYPMMEEMRRRKGMMAMQPKGKDGLVAATRVVDNRMPDHLKRGYYDDVYWKEFFAGSKEHLNEPKLGLRGDQLRARIPAKSPVAKPANTTRRTLAEVLGRMGKTMSDLGATPISNPHLDQPMPVHAKMHYPLH